MNGLKTVADFLCLLNVTVWLKHDSHLPLLTVKFIGQTNVNPSVLVLVHCTVINAFKVL